MFNHAETFRVEVYNVHLVVKVTVTRKDIHKDSQPGAWCRDKGSGELQPSDSFVSKTNNVTLCSI
jgi:hypothetical protein